MESSVEQRVKDLLEKWCKSGTRLHCCFLNKWEDWQFDGIGALEKLEFVDKACKVEFDGWQFSFAIGKARRLSIVNPNVVPEGLSFPESQPRTVGYVSENVLSIEIPEHSYLMFADMLDDSTFATV